jgi:hypothetical protein
MNLPPKIPLETEQAAMFDECVAELSQDARDFFAFAVQKIATSLAAGGGVKSAKAVLFEIARTNTYRALRTERR